MKYRNTLLVVADIDKSVDFYRNVLGLRVVADFGANKTLTGGICLQTLDSWKSFIGTEAVGFCGKDVELYFEEDNFDAFVEKLSEEEIQLVHHAAEQPWGQRAVRFYDPDCHIIEVGESMKNVCRRFLGSGMTFEQTAERMDVPIEYVRKCVGKDYYEKNKSI